MGGRGRGRGRMALSFNVEALGISKGEALPEPVAQPPPVYPPLGGRPAPLGHLQGLCYRDQLVAHWAPTRQALAPPPPKPIVDYKSEPTDEKPPTYSLQFQWFKFPAELRPSTKKKKTAQSTPAPKAVKRKATMDIEALLSHLEKNEENMDIKTEVEDEEENKDKNKEAEREEDEKELEEEEDPDEEMDEGTDYNQNYFDNGENYLDDDDDMDEGPVY